MKKLSAILLTLAMIIATNLTAFAVDTTVNITDDGDKTYYGYQLLFVTSSLKEDEHHTAHEGAHNGNCYNFSYTVNPKYRVILQNEVHSKGGNYLWEVTPKPATPTGITDKQIEEYLAHQSSDVGSEYHSMRQVADRLYRAILAAGNIDPDEDDLTGNGDKIDQGYWIFADATAIAEDESKSLVMVNTAGLNELNITAKTDLPTVEKKVKDIDDTRDSNIVDNVWSDSADHDIGDTVPFKLTATLPSNLRGYLELDANQNSVNPYKLIFHDTLSEGLTLAEDAVIKVYMYNTKHEADVDIDINSFAKDVTANFEIKRDGIADGCTFEAICEDIFAIEGVTKDCAFVVYYSAQLNNQAKIGATGNSNEVFLEFSNDPYGNTTGKTEEDVVMVYTYKLIVNKIDAEGHSLKGAGFTLYKKVLGSAQPDQYEKIGDEIKGEDLTQFVWKGLDDGDYKLVESTVPDGYNKMDDMTFTVTAEHSEIDGEIKLLALNGGAMGTGTVVDDVLTGEIEKDIVNNTGVELPSTGAQGTFWLIFGGAMIAILAAVFMITRKKMSIYED